MIASGLRIRRDCGGVTVKLEPGDFVAGYAALVATVALGWQIRISLRAKRPQVNLLLDTWRSSQAGRIRRSLDEVEIRIRNREDYPVRVERLYFVYPAYWFSAPISAEVKASDSGVVAAPFEVPGRDVVSLTLRPTRKYSVSSGGTSEIVPGVGMELRTGERYRSKSTGGRPQP
jgi:hypothetical protein